MKADISYRQPPALLRDLAKIFGCARSELIATVERTIGASVSGASSDEALLSAIRRALSTGEAECILAHARKIAAAN